MDEAQEIDHLINVMQQLQEMGKELENPDGRRSLIIALMITMIVSTPVPDIRILHQNTPTHTHIGLA